MNNYNFVKDFLNEKTYEISPRLHLFKELHDTVGALDIWIRSAKDLGTHVHAIFSEAGNIL